jgi:hypothetical protein
MHGKLRKDGDKYYAPNLLTGIECEAGAIFSLKRVVDISGLYHHLCRH